MKVLLENSIKIFEKPMFRCIISAVTQVKTTNESSYFAIVSSSL